MAYRESAFSAKQEIPPLFIPTVSLVAMAPLRLQGQPFDYREYSPTPLDPMLLSNADGPRYDQAALDYMDDARIAHAPEFANLQEALDWYDTHSARVPNPVWVSTMREIMTQHELKQRRNDRAIRALRKITTPVSNQEAEDIMQVRAGIASISTMLRFIAKYPQIGGLEIMKATRPGNVVATLAARAALLEELEFLNEPDIECLIETHEPRRLHIRPDPELQDTPDPRVVVFKTNIARAAVRLADETKQLEIVWRDSGVILDPKWDDLSDTYITGKCDDEDEPVVHIAPISVTAYARIMQD